MPISSKWRCEMTKLFKMASLALAFCFGLALLGQGACSPESLNEECVNADDCFEGFDCDPLSKVCLRMCNDNKCPTGYTCNTSTKLCERNKAAADSDGGDGGGDAGTDDSSTD